VKYIELKNGIKTKVDDRDYLRLSQYKWYFQRYKASGYVVRSLKKNGKRVLRSMHRMILDAPIGTEVDHKDGDGLNNQRSNLRLCTHQQNGFNQGTQRRKKSSKYKGVYWQKTIGKWIAKIKYNGKMHHIGCYINGIAAAQAYDKEARKHFGEFARPNNPRSLPYEEIDGLPKL